MRAAIENGSSHVEQHKAPDRPSRASELVRTELAAHVVAMLEYEPLQLGLFELAFQGAIRRVD